MSQISFYLYDSTGAIRGYGRNEEGMFIVPDGLLLGIGEATQFSHYVVDGSLVEYTADQTAAQLARPAYAATWSATAMAWIDQRSLATLKADLVASVEAMRDEMTFGDTTEITTDQGTFPTSGADVRQYRDDLLGWTATGAANASSDPGALDVDLVDGTTASLSLVQLQTLVSAIFLRDIANRAAARAVIEGVSAAASPAAAHSAAAGAGSATWSHGPS